MWIIFAQCHDHTEVTECESTKLWDTFGNQADLKRNVQNLGSLLPSQKKWSPQNAYVFAILWHSDLSAIVFESKRATDKREYIFNS